MKYIQTKPSSCCLKHHYSSVHWAILLRAPPTGLEYFCCRGCFLQRFFFFHLYTFSLSFNTSFRLGLWICIQNLQLFSPTKAHHYVWPWWPTVCFSLHVKAVLWHTTQQFNCNRWWNKHSDCMMQRVCTGTLWKCVVANCVPVGRWLERRAASCPPLAAFQSLKLEKCPHFCFSYQITPPLRLLMPQTLCAEGFGDKSWMEMKRQKEMTWGCSFELYGPTCLSRFRKSH